MGIIKIEGIRLYAYHGCLEEEAKIGADYIVDVTLETDFSAAAANDNIAGTIDYVTVYDIVKQEMAVRSKLIEHVGKRIIDKLNLNFKTLQNATVKVTKLNPPMNGNVEKVSIIIS
jgi:dihydroneopterin aldolase